MFNQAVWDSYPEALQNVIEEGLEMAREKQLEYTDETCAAALEVLRAAVIFTEASDEEIAELKALWQPIVEEYVSSKWIDAIAEFREANQ